MGAGGRPVRALNGITIRKARTTTVVRVWDPQTGRLLRETKGHAAAVRGVACVPGGDRFVTAGEDGVVALWDGRAEQPTRTLCGAD